jgi:acyl-CoA dehydrogenase
LVSCSVEAKIRAAEKAGVFDGVPEANVRDIAHAAFAKGVVSAEEYALLKRRNALRDFVIHVDDFPFDYGFGQKRAAAPIKHNAAA